VPRSKRIALGIGIERVSKKKGWRPESVERAISKEQGKGGVRLGNGSQVKG